MPDYVPIQDLTIASSIGDDDLFPMSDGSGAFAVRGSTIKSYAATDAAAAADDAEASKTAAQNAADSAALAQGIAEAAAATAAAANAATGDIKTALDGRILVSPTWENGRYSPETGAKVSSSTHIRISSILAYDEKYAIIISNHRAMNIRVRLGFYGSNEGYIGESGYLERSFLLKDIIPAGTAYFSISAANASGAASGSPTTAYGDCVLITDWHNTLLPVDDVLINTQNALYGRKRMIPVWESGRWNPVGGEKTTGTGYIRTADKLPYSNDLAIMITNQFPVNVRIRVGFYDANEDYLDYMTPFIDRSFLLRGEAPDGTAYFVISAVKASGDTNIGISYGSTIEITDWHDTLFPKSGKLNDAGLVTLEDIIQFADENGVFSESFDYNIPFSNNFDNQIFTCVAKYTRDEGATGFPCIQFGFGWTGINGTTYYEIGQEGAFVSKQWRVGRPYPEMNAIKMRVVIPDGIHVKIKQFYNTYDNHIERSANTIRFDGHRKFPGMPSDTMPSVEMCAKIGFGSMIQIPKRLSDGVWIFYHDDSLKYDDTYIRQSDGSLLPSTYNGTLWKNISSQTAFSWDWGISFHDGEYAGTPPMTMQDFFLACAKSGMKPMLSIHPEPSESEYAEIKSIAKKYGVLDKLGIVAVASYIPRAFSVLGNDIDSYVLLLSSGNKTSADIAAAISVLDGLTGCTTRRAIELFASTAYDAYFGNSPYNAFEMIEDAGYIASLTSQNSATKPVSGNTGPYEYGPDIEYWISRGVSEFCFEQGYNSGLIW